MISKKSMMILLVGGIGAFSVSGCATLKTAKDLILPIDDDQSVSVDDVMMVSRCLPEVPALPPALDDEVVLKERDIHALLIYFRNVEYCRDTAQGIGL